MPTVILVLGGARSGKSRFAETLAEESGVPVYLATAQAFDDEMADRIRRHQSRRGGGWRTVEAPLALLESLVTVAAPGVAVLVDCLTLWISNLMLADADVDAAIADLLAGLDRLTGTVVLVSSEVGLGIVPDNALARRFRDHAGDLHQALAARADAVFFVAAGLPLVLKDTRRSRQ